MEKALIVVTAESPLSLGAAKSYQQNIIESRGYIPGNSLRGALGRMNLANPNGLLEEVLQASGERVAFPDCLCGLDGCISLPYPATALTCKRPGEKSAPPGQRHDAFDSLISTQAYRLVAGEDRRNLPIPLRFCCPACGGRVVPVATEGYLFTREKGKGDTGPVRKHRQVKVAINRHTLAAEEGRLYSIECLNPGQAFCGIVDVPTGGMEKFRTALESVRHVGGRLSRGYGQVRITVKPAAIPSLADRLDGFNAKLRQYWEAYSTVVFKPGLVDPIQDRLFFSLDLMTDGRFLERGIIPQSLYTIAMLEEDLRRHRLKLAGLRAHVAHARSLVYQGFQTGGRQAWKEAELLTRRGSVFVFSCAENQREHLHEALQILEFYGIGYDPGQCRGQVLACHPFHLEVKQS